MFLKDRNRRFSYFILEKKLILLKSIFYNLNLSEDIRTFAYTEFLNLIKFNSHTKIRNRCLVTNRARAVYRKFKMSRIFFKQYALEGELMGVQKAS